MPRKRDPKPASPHDLGDSAAATPDSAPAAPAKGKKGAAKEKGKEPTAEKPPADSETPTPPPPTPPDPFPYAKEPAVQGGIIIKIYDSTVPRDMTQDDVNAAAEHSGSVSEDYFEVLEHKDTTEKRIKRLEEELRDTRGIFRAAEERLLELGGELAEIARQTNTHKRTCNTKVTETLTLQNEIIVRDAATGEVLPERRRTATAEEAAKAQEKQMALLNPSGTGAAAPAAPIEDKGKKEKPARDTTDSPTPKPDPGEEMLAYSISAKAFGALSEKRQDYLRQILPDDPESKEKPWLLNWESEESAERLHVRIPRRLAPKLQLLCYDVDLKKGNLQ